MRMTWAQPPALVNGKAAGGTERKGERSDGPTLPSERESSSHQSMGEEREGSKLQPETLGQQEREMP